MSETEQTTSATEQSQVIEGSTHSPADAAAAFFAMSEPKLVYMINQLSAKQLRRLVMNVVTFPIGKKPYPLTDDNQKSAAYLISEMLMNRTIMQLTLEMEKADKATAEEVNKIENKYKDITEEHKIEGESNETTTI